MSSFEQTSKGVVKALTGETSSERGRRWAALGRPASLGRYPWSSNQVRRGIMALEESLGGKGAKVYCRLIWMDCTPLDLS